jgi:hypothetical protein
VGVAAFGSLLKKASSHSVPETTVPEAVVFPQELALAKPVAHDEFTVDRFFNGWPAKSNIKE